MAQPLILVTGATGAQGGSVARHLIEQGHFLARADPQSGRGEILANMFDFNRRFILSRQADMEECKRLYPGMQRFDAWAESNRQALEGVL